MKLFKVNGKHILADNFSEAIETYKETKVNDMPRLGTVKQSAHVLPFKGYFKQIMSGKNTKANIDSMLSELKSLYEDMMFDYRKLHDDFLLEVKSNYKEVYDICKKLQKMMNNDVVDKFVLQYEDKLKHING